MFSQRRNHSPAASSCACFRSRLGTSLQTGGGERDKVVCEQVSWRAGGSSETRKERDGERQGGKQCKQLDGLHNVECCAFTIDPG